MTRDKRGTAGQSTLEYALVLFAFLSLVVAFAALWRMARQGVLLERSKTYASHNFEKGLSIELLQDLTAS
ncbi:MAG: hypothetical protein J6S63_03585 [Atopobiaceae bacterium]|nr:hypothetical protein [Atopobiaceae bacterium]